MKPSSAKGKGRNFQKWVKALLHKYFPSLEPDDILSRSMGAGGEDIMLSPAARKLIPLSIECKHNARFSIYKIYEQAVANSGDHEPIAFIKQNNSKPLVIVDADYFVKLLGSK